MKRKILFFLLLNLSILPNIFGQNVMLTAEEKAIMYHVVVQTKSLERNVGDLFEYKGDTVYYVYDAGHAGMDSIVDFDSIEQIIVYEPALLDVNFYEIQNLPSGILNELSTKMALQVTYKELKRRNEKKPEGISDSVYVKFMDHFARNLPDEAVRIKGDKRIPLPKLDDLLDPNLTFNERVKMLNDLSGFNLVQQKEILDALNNAIQYFIQEKSYEFFRKLGGEAGPYRAVLAAVGDGSGTAGLLYERELVRKGRKKLGKTKGVGLFTYETAITSGEHNAQYITAKQSSLKEFTAIKDEFTNVHFNIYGFNSRQQATVVITREQNSYLLYASKISKELTPDTTFGQGQTIHSIIRKLEMKSIPEVDEQINGKTGLKYWVKYYEDELADNGMKIKETEFELDKNRYSQKANQKKISILQQRLTNLYNRKPVITKKLRETQEELRIEEERLQRFRYRLEELKSFLGDFRMDYSRFGYVYTFEDGCTFNTYTQDFKFPDSLKVEDFQVRIISIGPDAMTERVDEVQLEIGVTKGKPEDKDVNEYFVEFEDVFKSDRFELDKFKLNPVDLYEVSKLLNVMYVQQGDLVTNINGWGVGKQEGTKVVPSSEKELDAYPGESDEEKAASRASNEFARLRYCDLDLNWKDGKLILNIDSYTDPVKSNFSKKDIRVKPIKEKYADITENDLLSAFRSFFIAEKFFGELMRAAYFNTEDKEKEKLLAVLKKKMEGMTVKVKDKSIPYSDYASVMHKEVDYYSILMEKFKLKEDGEKALLDI